MIAQLLAPQRVLGLVATGLNRVLAGQPAAQAELGKLNGRVLDVRVSRLGWRVCVAFEDNGVVLATSSARQADVRIEGSLSDLLAMGRARQRGEPVPAGKVRLEGDLATVQLTQAVFEALALDWEAFLAQYMGELPARQVARVLVGLFDWLGRARNGFERDMGEFLRTETRLLPAVDEVDAFAAEVMRLANDVERVAARVQRLRQRVRRS